MGGLFAAGLASVPAKLVERVKSSLSALGHPELAEGLDRFVITDDPQRRFKMATRLVLALDQLAFSLIEPPQLASATLRPLQGAPAVRMAPAGVPSDEAEVRRLASGSRSLVELLEYLRSTFDPAAASLETVVTLLTNAHAAPEVLARLADLPAERRIDLGTTLLDRHNRLLRAAGVSLLTGVPGDEAHRVLLGHLADPLVRREADAYLRSNAGRLGAVAAGLLADATEPVLRRHLARILRLSRPEKDLIPHLKALEKDSDPAVTAFATLALLVAGAGDAKVLRQYIGDMDNTTLRIYAKLELLRSGEIDRRYLLAEFNSEDPSVHETALTAMREIGDHEMLAALEPLVQEARFGKTRSIRKTALLKLRHLHGSVFEPLFVGAAADPDPDVAAVARTRLVELWGFPALELFHDPWRAIDRDPTGLSLDELHALNYYVLPHVAVTGDGRFAAYLAHLFADFCGSGRQYDYEHDLKPRLIDFGEPLVPLLAEYLFVPDQTLSLAAEDLLLHIGGPTAKRALADFHSGTPPIEVAFRQLGNPATAEGARAVIIAEGPGTIPSLLELLGDPKCRGEVLRILVAFKEPSTFPAMLRLLGNPAPELLVSGDISVMLRDTGFADREITHRLIELGEPIVDPLVEKLTDENWTVRYHAALVLGRVGCARATMALIRTMQRESDSVEVVRACVTALGALGATEAVPLLTPYLTDVNREVRIEAYAALGLIGNPEAAGPLQEALAGCRNLAEKRLIQRALERLRGEGR